MLTKGFIAQVCKREVTAFQLRTTVNGVYMHLECQTSIGGPVR